MQSQDTLMCFEVHTNNFLTVLMFVGQFDPHSFFVSRQLYRPKLKIFFGCMLLFWYFTILERKKNAIISIFKVYEILFNSSFSSRNLCYFF